jgi:tetratricopeptide (TPR) repeat protein
MTRLTFISSLLAFGIIFISFSSCKKYLDAKPDASLSTLSTPADVQAFLDNTATMNLSLQFISEMFSDNYYMTSASWSGLTIPFNREVYLWNKFDIPENICWLYEPVLYSNIVLDELPKLENSATSSQYAQLEGSALFFRAFHHFSLAQVFAQPYNKSSSTKDLGLPLRLTSDYTVKSTRASVEETYQQIIKDLKESVNLLPLKPAFKTRPSIPAAYGTLARIYLSMQEYDSAGLYADKCLKIYDSLMDFNIVSSDFAGTSASAPIKRFNREVIFHARSLAASTLATSRAKVDSVLYNSYNNNDLRKSTYFKPNTGTNAGSYAFKGDYDGAGTNSGYTYVGIVTDELYLTRAECFVRKGNIEEAKSDLTTLLKKRWKSSVPLPELGTDQNTLLTTILSERRKELFFRSTRWIDLRRLMTDPSRAVTPKRIINGQEYVLEPGSTKYTVQVPSSVIKITEMQQNP